jgi:hypothetical protein
MALKGYVTIQARHAKKHYDKISNMVCFSLENHFSGKPVVPENQDKVLEFCLEKCGDKLQVNKETGKGRIRQHSNCWYEFDYKA